MLIVHVFLTSGILAIIGYQIIAVDNFIDKLRYFLHMIGWVGMLFLTCFYGQLILNEVSVDIIYLCTCSNNQIPIKFSQFGAVFFL